MSKTAAEIENDIRQAARKCSLAGRGLWDVFRDQIEFGKSDRDGHLMQGCRPLSLDGFALLARSSADEVTRLLQELVTWGLVAVERSHDSWHSPLLSRLAQAKAKAAGKQRRYRAKTGGNVTPLVTPPVTPVVTANGARASPEVSLLPHTPSSLPNPNSNSSNWKEDASRPSQAASSPGVGEKAKRKSRRVRTDEEHRNRAAFIRWFSQELWPACFDGVAYDFDSDDSQKRQINHQAVWRFLDDDAIGFDMGRAREAAGYFAEFCAFNRPCWPCPLQQLAKRAGKYLEAAKRPRRSYVLGAIGNVGGAKPSAGERGFEVDNSRLVITGASAAG